MTKTTRAYSGLLGLICGGLLVVGCGSSSSNGTGTGGKGGSSSTGTGGSSSTGTGGSSSTGTGGTTGTGTGGSTGTGTGGTGVAAGCPSGTAPPAALITDFAGGADGGSYTFGLGGSFTYGTPVPTVAITNGTLHATLTSASVAATAYVGFGLYFNSCVDASAYTGVKFKLSGTLSAGCTMQYSHNFAGDANSADGPNGACTVSAAVPACYAPQKTIATIPATPTDVTVTFTEVMGGAPLMVVDKTKLTGIGWQFTVPTTGCTADITIDDVTFVGP